MRDKISALLVEKLQACPTRKDNIIDESEEIHTPQKHTSPKSKK